MPHGDWEGWWFEHYVPYLLVCLSAEIAKHIYIYNIYIYTRYSCIIFIKKSAQYKERQYIMLKVNNKEWPNELQFQTYYNIKIAIRTQAVCAKCLNVER